MSRVQDDGSEDVADFLERIRELGDRTKREDEERSRKLEEEILQGRKEREARRAERARSISPTKDSPMATPPTFSKPRSPDRTPTRSLRAIPPQDIENPVSKSSIGLSSNDRTTSKTMSINLDLEPSKPSPPPSATTLSRSGTLSWQQRPTPKGGSSRPNSLLSLDNKNPSSPRASPMPESAQDGPSRQDIVQSFEGKDPNWFKQTADRGMGSAAYRKSQERELTTGNSVQLPGLKAMEQDTGTKLSRSRVSQDSTQTHGAVGSRDSWTMPLPGNSKSPLPTSAAQRFEPPMDASRELSPTRQPAMSSAQRNISPERPLSPTKGLGGFVQSAMLKRSDSLNKHKRGGSQATLPLSRSNSVINNDKEIVESKNDTGPTSTKLQEANIRETEVNRPLSPVRPVDSKRWSPTKQSWLEGAISKNDAPRPKSGSSNQSPPMWLSELQKSKESSAGAASEKPITHKPIETGGLLRKSQDFPKARPGLSVITSAKINGNTDAIRSLDNVKNDDAAEMRTRGLGIKSSSLDSPTKPPSTASQAIQPRWKADNSSSQTPATFPGPPPMTSPKPTVSRALPNSPPERPVAPKPAGLKSSAAAPVEAKFKVEETSKKDFRAGLRSVATSTDKSKSEELEFHNVFGRLKKTETKNYVAPDELKANILRGKTGLNVTGGPRAYEKKDEFKDSILKKKEEMKAGISVKAKSPEPVAKPTVPEAIARQQRLAQNTTARPTVSQEKPAITPKPITTTAQSVAKTKEPTRLIDPFVHKSATDPKPVSSASNEHLRSPGAVKQSSVQEQSAKPLILEKKTSAPAQLQGNATSSAFADRFNPALAGILARGPPAASKGIAQPARTASPTDLRDEPSGNPSSTSATRTELTHATKGRAKGPKRRLPGNAKGGADKAEAQPSPKPSSLVERPLPDLHVKPLAVEDAKSKDLQTKEINREIRSQSSTSSNTVSREPPVIASTAKKPTVINTEIKTRQESAPIPIKVEPTKAVPLVAKEMEPKDVSRQDQSQRPPVAPKSPELSNKSPKSPKSPPTPGNKAQALSRISSSGQASDRLRVPAPGGTLDAFFDHLLLPKINTDINTQALLLNPRANETNIRTLKKDIWEITGDGRKTPLSQHKEYILFEDHMYLCRHHYEDEDGKQNIDAYLWCGDGVSPAAIEDAQVFCGSTAREAGCKLQTLSQGKETIKFFEALGGIVIIRRRNSATYMLCGRRHLGRIVFDEVEFSAESLCSGFTFIIATTGGDLYLWKGSGANADEIGCARLIGMDLGLTGEIEEVEEGKEPAELLRVLKLTKLETSSSLWKHKASMDKYSTRLFNVDADLRPRSSSSLSNFAANMWRRRPSSPSLAEPSEGKVNEISPYTQSDIVEDQIFVLDAFFEIFVIAGSQTRSKFSSFALALNFAQEYGILSVSIQDRPFIPKGYVLFLGAAGDLPAGFCTAFRKWDSRIHRQQSSWATQNVLMPLHDALRALEGLNSSSSN